MQYTKKEVRKLLKKRRAELQAMELETSINKAIYLREQKNMLAGRIKALETHLSQL